MQNPPKFNMDTKNHGLEHVSPFKYGHVWYLFVKFLWVYPRRAEKSLHEKMPSFQRAAQGRLGEPCDEDDEEMLQFNQVKRCLGPRDH